MEGLSVPRRRRTVFRTVFRTLCSAASAVAVLGAAASCSTDTGGGSAGTPSAPTAAATATSAGPVTVELNQFRDNYSNQIIEIQLTNTTVAPLTVLGAELSTPLFAAPIAWPATAGGIVLPPGQTKSLPAPLSAPECNSTGASRGVPGDETGGTTRTTGSAQVTLRLAPPAAAATDPATGPTTAEDPFGVLARNNAEMCLTREAAAVAAFALAPDLEVAADGRTAVVRLLVTPAAAKAGGTGGAGAGELVIDRIDETTLLAESPVAPWPRAVTVRAGGAVAELRLGIRPARCDPHAVAEDKVGTLLPLRITVAGREGVLKIAAGDKLRGQIYDFVTTACGRQ
ncbi:hypothetical protein GCM10009825_34970 [Arthrobacter humicola]|uniref:Uncharacterized protein n=1 Tax=Arthrobacter humicola TaxID=409291 RepID=A0ABN2ZLD2_9MICC